MYIIFQNIYMWSRMIHFDIVPESQLATASTPFWLTIKRDITSQHCAHQYVPKFGQLIRMSDPDLRNRNEKTAALWRADVPRVRYNYPIADTTSGEISVWGSDHHTT